MKPKPRIDPSNGTLLHRQIEVVIPSDVLDRRYSWYIALLYTAFFVRREAAVFDLIALKTQDMVLVQSFLAFLAGYSQSLEDPTEPPFSIAHQGNQTTITWKEGT